MPASQLVILLHGIGGSGASMSPIAAVWRPSLPETRIVAPDAPFPYAYGSGHQWFAVDGGQMRPERIRDARSGFDDLIAKIVVREGFRDKLSKVAFVGVSQGAIVALDAVASGRWQIGVLVTFAGLLPPGRVSPKAIGTNVLLLHGAEDTTIPSAASDDASARFRAAGVTAESRIFPGVGHTISLEESIVAVGFLKSAND
jgi:phospholipase/carboxylesterase